MIDQVVFSSIHIFLGFSKQFHRFYLQHFVNLLTRKSVGHIYLYTLAFPYLQVSLISSRTACISSFVTFPPNKDVTTL